MQEQKKKQIRRYKWTSFRSVKPLINCPFGYIRDENDPLLYHPIPDALDILEAGKIALSNGRSVREVAKWISEQTGISISHTGLVKRVENDNKKFRKKEPTGQTKYVDVTDLVEPTAKEELNDLWKKKRINKRKLSNKDRKKEKIKEKRRKLSDYKGVVTRLKKSLKTEIEQTKDEELKKELTQLVNDEVLNTEIDIVDDEQNIAFKPNDGPQTDFLACSEDEVFYGGGRGSGKCLKYNDFLVTPFGMRQACEIKAGDTILNPNGEPQKVLIVYQREPEDLYEVIFEDDRSCTVTLDHLWLIHKSNKSTKKKSYYEQEHKGRLWTTQMIIDHLEKVKESKRKQTQHISVPLCDYLKFTKTYRYDHREINPYILGLLLGDGCITGSGLLSFASLDDELVDAFRKEYGEECIVNYKNSKDCCWTLRYVPKLISSLKTLKLYGTNSSNKFIPECYKWGTVEQRLELLRGLMDTDGYVDDRGHSSYTSISYQLIKDVQWLVRSLGGKGNIQEKYPQYTYKNEKKFGQKAYTLHIQMKNPKDIFKLKRKKDRAEKYCYNGGVGSSELRLRIKEVKKVDKERSICFVVDNPNRLFLTNDFIVTHNSYALLADPMRYFHHPKFSGLLVRRTMPELRDLIHESRQLYGRVFPKAQFKVQESVWHFPSGARMEFGYAENDVDAERYRGRQYCWIGIDELPQFPTPDVYNLLKSSNRTSAPDLPTYMRATGNPMGGSGSKWVKEKFIDPAPFNTTFYENSEFYNPLTKERKHVRRSIKYVPATVFDNPYLLQNDNYIAALASLPEHQKQQMLYGNWDIIENGAFPEFNRQIHVKKSDEVDIAPYMVKFRAVDWGYNSPFCCLWFAVDEDNTIYVYREYYGSQVLADDFANRIADIEEENHEAMDDAVIDGSTNASRGERGPTIFETINETLKKRRRRIFRAADRSSGSRAAGKQEIHKRLALRPTGLKDENGQEVKRPSLYILNTCVNLIRTISSIQIDKNDPEKYDTKGEDHAIDALQYGLRSRPISPNRVLDRKLLERNSAFRPADAVLGY